MRATWEVKPNGVSSSLRLEHLSSLRVHFIVGRRMLGTGGGRRIAREVLEGLMARGATTRDSDDLRRPAVVFSPHFDDETLGCGGTILKKRALGAPVTIVFMTDGRKSHEAWIAPDELAQLRAAEGIAAARALGVAEEDVRLLGFEETRLSEREDDATTAVLDLLRARQPEEVYVPHALEPPADHAATCTSVRRAIQALGRRMAVYEYPIWLWDYWPWTPAARAPGERWRHMVREQLRMNALLVRELKHRVFVGDVLEQKRRALGMHETQMTRMRGSSTWPILGDVGDGDWLGQFFVDYELFSCREGA